MRTRPSIQMMFVGGHRDGDIRELDASLARQSPFFWHSKAGAITAVEVTRNSGSPYRLVACTVRDAEFTLRLSPTIDS